MAAGVAPTTALPSAPYGGDQLVQPQSYEHGLVVRLYEPHGGRGLARLAWPSWLPVTSVTLVDLLERDVGDSDGAGVGGAGRGSGSGGSSGGGRLRIVPVAAGSGEVAAGVAVELSYAPFQLISLRLELAASAGGGVRCLPRATWGGWPCTTTRHETP